MRKYKKLLSLLFLFFLIKRIDLHSVLLDACFLAFGFVLFTFNF